MNYDSIYREINNARNRRNSFESAIREEIEEEDEE